MAKSDPRSAPAPKPKPLPIEAIGLRKDEDGKWCVYLLQIEDEMVLQSTIIEKSIHRDLAQDAARRLVLRLK